MKKKPTELELTQNFVFGKFPPQATDLEEMILGAVMLEQHCYSEINDIIQAKVFYKNEHQLIWSAFDSLAKENKPIDLILVTNHLRSIGNLELCGGAYYVSELTNRLASAANVRYHAMIVYQKFIAREIIRISTLSVQNAYDETIDTLELAENTIANFQKVITDIPTENLVTEDEAILSSLDAIKNSFENKVPIGIKTGLLSVDFKMGGLRNGELIIVAARPSMGKTTLSIQLALNFQAQNIPCAFYSYEMSRTQLVNKMLANLCNVDSEKITNGDLNKSEYDALQGYKKSQTPIFISDKIITIDALFNQCLKLKGQIGCLIVDYLQLITINTERIKERGMNREQQISYVSSRLKQIAKEVNVPVIALAQLSRAVASEGGAKIPELHHLRESGSIEQDADVVLFPHRPEYYGILEDENGESTLGKAWIYCKKNRNGKLFDAELKFENKYSRFIDTDNTLSKIGYNNNSLHNFNNNNHDPF